MPASVRRLRAAASFVLACVATAVQAQICTPFTDVAATNPFCSSIQWMYNRGVTLGCNTNVYCPDQFVRRDQMAAFMYRLGFQNVFLNGGNAFGGSPRIGTNDNYPLEIVVDAQRAMRFEPTPFSPNVIGGHQANEAAPGVRGATIAGGGIGAGDSDPDFSSEAPNRVHGAYGTVGGGMANTAGADDGNPVDSAFATVAGGTSNVASGLSSTVGGGVSNFALGGVATIGGGANNFANAYATVPGGANNSAIGVFSFAAGHRAKATAAGSFMWADASDVDFGVNEANFFGVRATGGVGFTVAIDANGGGTQFCDLRPGIAGWQCVSDRDAKENLERAPTGAILEKLAGMPLYSWNFRGADPAIRNLGPTAQDFRAAFHLGNDDDKSIAEGNLHGVALAAIQGLNAKLEALVALQGRAIDAQRERIAALERALDELATPTRTTQGRHETSR